MENIGVYLKKDIVFSLPLIVPQPPTLDKQLKKPKEKENALYPKLMVSHLTSLLVPEELRSCLYPPKIVTTLKNSDDDDDEKSPKISKKKRVPLIIFRAIKCKNFYLNRGEK